MQKAVVGPLRPPAGRMGAATRTGGATGGMIDAHSIALACLVGLVVTLQAYVWPFTLMVIH